MDKFANLKPTKHKLTNGGQGTVQVVKDPNGHTLVKKTMLSSATVAKRTEALVGLSRQISSPYIAMPNAWRKTKNGKIQSLAPFIEGVSLEEDQARGLPELLEIALHGVSQWVLLEDSGLAHGDIAPGNILISLDGATYWIDFDGANLPGPGMPPPETIGQRPMLAPELRSGSQAPSITSDRYAMGVYLNMLLLCRHPIDGLAKTPVETDDFMSRNFWPERIRTPEAGDTPIEALSEGLMDLFDRAFSINPNVRPSAKEWQLELTHALENTWVHDCGGAFVGADPHTLTCPHCGEIGARPPEVPLAANTGQSVQVRLRVPDYSIDEILTLTPPQVFALGRDTIPALPQTISGKHLHLAWIRGQLTIQHVGRNQSLVDIEHSYAPFTLVTLCQGETANLKLAGVDVVLEI